MAEKLGYQPEDYLYRDGPDPFLGVEEFDQMPAQAPAAAPSIQYNTATSRFFVPGFGEFDADDHASAVASMEGARNPNAVTPQGAGWTGVDTDSFAAFVHNIKNPGLGTLASKSFGRGVDQLQQLGGQALQAVGVEGLGGDIAAAQEEELRKTSPYARDIEGISEPNRGVLDWAVANIAQQGPNIISSLASGGMGAAAGTLVGKALIKHVGSQAYKKTLAKAANKYATGKARSALEEKSLRVAAGVLGNTVGKKAATRGAIAGATAQNYAMGVGEIYGESGDRLSAFAGAVPYAALESAAEVVLMAPLFGNLVPGGKTIKDMLRTAPAKTRKGALAKGVGRGVGGLTVGGAAEGLTEVGQESLGIYFNPDMDFDSPEVASRLMNAFAAGAVTGGAIGGGVNLFNREKPADMLNAGEEVDESSREINNEPYGPNQPEQFPTPVGPQQPSFGPQQPNLADPQQPAPPPDFSPTVGLRPQGAAITPGQLLQQRGPVSEQGAPLTPGDLLAGDRPAAPYTIPSVTPPPTAPQAPLGFSLGDIGTPVGGQTLAQLQEPAPAPPAAEFTPPLTTGLQGTLDFRDQSVLQQTAAQEPLNYDDSIPEAIPFDSSLLPDQDPFGTTTLGQGRLPNENQARHDAATALLAQQAMQSQIDAVEETPVSTTKKAKPTGKRRGVKKAEGTVKENKNKLLMQKALRRKAASEKADAATKTVYAIALPAKTKSGLKRVPDTRFDTEEAARAYGEKYHKGRFTVVEHPDTKKAADTPQRVGESKASVSNVTTAQKGVAKLKATPVAAEATEQNFIVEKRRGKKTLVKKPASREVSQKNALKKPESQAEEAAEQQDALEAAIAETVAEDNKVKTEAKVEETTGVAETAEFKRVRKETEAEADSPAAYGEMIHFAYDTGGSDTVKKNKAAARKYLYDADEGMYHTEAFREAILEYAAENPVGSHRGQLKPHIKDLHRMGLLEKAIADGAVDVTPAFKKALEQSGIDIATETRDTMGMPKPYQKLLGLIDRFNDKGSTQFLTPREQAAFTAARRAAGDKILAMEWNGSPLSAYFKTDNTPNTVRLDDDTVKIIPRADKGRFSTQDYNLIEGQVDLNGNKLKPMSVGAVQLKAGTFRKKLHTNPTIRVFKNQADLKKKDPALYKKAKGARTDNQFDTANAVGYSIGDGTTLLFAERVMNKHHLDFVLAHETIGHDGFRAVVPRDKWASVLGDLYDNMPETARFRIDAAVEARGMAKHEAVEEYMADMAGVLDASILHRLYNKVKSFFNKLGITFADDTVRFWLDRARVYTRYGKFDSDPIIMSRILDRLKLVEGGYDPNNMGRFSMVDAPGLPGMLRNSAQKLINDDPNPVTRMERLKGYLNNNVFNLSRLMTELRLTNYHARENWGMAQVYGALDEMTNKTRSLTNTYNRMLHKTLNQAMGKGKHQFWGNTAEQRAVTSSMLHESTRYGHHTVTEAMANKYGALTKSDADGVMEINWDVVNEMEATLPTFEMFRDGFSFKSTVELTNTDARRADLRAKRDKEIADWKTKNPLVAKINVDAQVAKIKKKWRPDIEAEVYEDTQKEVIKPRSNLKEDSIEWEMFLEVRRGMIQSFADLALSQHAKAEGKWEHALQRMARTLGQRKISDTDKQFLTDVRDKYNKMLSDEKEAGSFIAGFNEVLIANGTDKIKPFVKAYYKGDPAVEARIEKFRADHPTFRSAVDSKRYNLQHDLTSYATSMQEFDSESTSGKMNILRGYIPLIREGAWQMRLQAVDAEGKPVIVHESIARQFVFTKLDKEADADRLGQDFEKEFAAFGDPVMPVWNAKEQKYINQKVKFKAVVAKTQELSLDTTTGSIHEALHILQRYGIQVGPDKRAELVKNLSDQNEKVRKRLMRKDVPGVNEEHMLQGVSQHLESYASLVARNSHMHKIDSALDENTAGFRELWYGSPEMYAKLEKRFKKLEAIANKTARQKVEYLEAKREFEEYHFKHKVNKAQKLGGKYVDDARRLVAFVQSQKDIATSDILGGGDFVSGLRNWTVTFQLGGSMATAALNIISLPTNLVPALASYNPKTAFGGGFGVAKSSAALARALRETSLGIDVNRDPAGYFSKLLKDAAALRKSGFSKEDAEFLHQGVLSGRFDAAAVNSMQASSRGRKISGGANKAVAAFMAPFSVSEQMSRRAGGLASFRLQHEKLLSEAKQKHGVNLTEAQRKEVYDKSADFGYRMLDETIGQYANIGIPPMFRGGLKQFIFMYKVFPMTSAMLMRNMSYSGKIGMLGMLIILGGIKGVPFAEDFMDMLDTLAQQILGMRIGSVEAEFYKMADNLVPGVSGAVLMHGVVDRFLGLTLSTRTQVGDIIPGTEIFLPGVDRFREGMAILGPMFSAGEQSLATVANLGKWGLGSVGLAKGGTTLTKIMRDSPITMLRAAGDAIDYHAHGAVLNKRGQMVTPEMNAFTIMGRLAGFYPAAASKSYIHIAMMRRVGNYRNAVSQEFKDRWVNAKLTGGDTRAVEEDLKYWNKYAKHTGLEISKKGWRTALRAAKRPVAERNRDATARALRKFEKEMATRAGLS